MRKLLHDKKAKLAVVNLGQFHAKEKELEDFMKDEDFTAIVAGWCYSKDGNATRFLTKSGICAQIFLTNARVLVTGNIHVPMDEDQKKTLDEAARMISEMDREEEEVKSSPALETGRRISEPCVFIIYGPHGKIDKLSAMILPSLYLKPQEVGSLYSEQRSPRCFRLTTSSGTTRWWSGLGLRRLSR